MSATVFTVRMSSATRGDPMETSSRHALANRNIEPAMRFPAEWPSVAWTHGHLPPCAQTHRSGLRGVSLRHIVMRRRHGAYAVDSFVMAPYAEPDVEIKAFASIKQVRIP